LIWVLAEDIDSHADMVIHALQKRGAEVLRINPERLDERLRELSFGLEANGKIAGQLTYLNRRADLAEVDAVFCRNYYFPFAEDSLGKDADDLLISKELKAAFMSLCECLDCLWVNAPWDMDICENKAVQMQVARRLGFLVPELLITNNPESLQEFSASQDVVVKQLSNICVFAENGDSAKALYTHLITPEDLEHLEDLKLSPAFFSNFIDKEYDVRVTVIGKKMFAVKIFSQVFDESKVDFRRKEGDHEMEAFELPQEITDKIMRLMQHFNLQFGALDFAVDREGRYWFLEVNSEGNWLWMESALDLPISDAIAYQLTVS
jgi:glutathione synthase/RimK-type ligase-like ATP-grasp enzyme